MAVPPDLVGFTESAGVAAVGFGPEAQSILDAHREFWTCFFSHPWRVRDLIRARLAIAGPLLQGWQDMSTTLRSLADGADLIFTGINFEDAAANVAEHYDIPLATLHYFPLRPNRQTLRFLPAPVRRSAVAAFWWVSWRGTKKAEDAQRRRTGPAEGKRLRAAADYRTRIAGNPGLRRGVLSRAGSRMGGIWASTSLCRHADAGIADGRRRRGRILDRRGNTADLLRVRQHSRRISRRHDRHDRRGMRAVRRAGVGWRRRNRLQQRPAFRPRQGSGHGELRRPSFPPAAPSFITAARALHLLPCARESPN